MSILSQANQICSFHTSFGKHWQTLFVCFQLKMILSLCHVTRNTCRIARQTGSRRTECQQKRLTCFVTLGSKRSFAQQNRSSTSHPSFTAMQLTLLTKPLSFTLRGAPIQLLLGKSAFAQWLLPSYGVHAKLQALTVGKNLIKSITLFSRSNLYRAVMKTRASQGQSVAVSVTYSNTSP